MQTIIWTNEYLASDFHPSQCFLVFIIYLLFNCHMKTFTEGLEEKKITKRTLQRQQGLQVSLWLQIQSPARTSGCREGVKSHFCLSDLQILNKNSQIVLFWKQLTEPEYILFSLWNLCKVNRTEPGEAGSQLRIPSDCTDSTGRFRDTFPAETLPQDTKARMFWSRCFQRQLSQLCFPEGVKSWKGTLQYLDTDGHWRYWGELKFCH